MSSAARPAIALVLDCADADRLSEFWAGALGYDIAGRLDQYVALRRPDSTSPWADLLLQEVPEPRAAKNRLHIDLHPDGDLDAEVARLVALGATTAEEAPRELGRTRWRLLADPEGNELCVVVSR